MKAKLTAVALVTVTAVTVAIYPSVKNVGAVTPVQVPVVAPQVNEKPRVEVVFVLDTTGSMSGLIQAAKEKIWSIASTMGSAQQAPEIKMGLVAYRDRGDDYVTKVVDLSSDLDTMYATLMDFQAGGGGDTPESVNQALRDAVHQISWSEDQDTYKVVFLVGDAPPHMDYRDDVKYPETIAAGLAKGIVFNAIQCGQVHSTARHWEQLAALGHGRHFQVEQTGSAVAISTPFDDKLAALSTELDDTRLYYGSEEEKEKQQVKLDATDKLHAASSVSSRARRAVFNASQSGTANFLGKGELIDDVANGRVDLSDIAPAEMPESIKAMAPEEQQAAIEDRAERRLELKREIQEIAQKRDSYLKEKVDEAGGVAGSLDDQIYGAVRAQAAKKGFSYDADAPAY